MARFVTATRFAPVSAMNFNTLTHTIASESNQQIDTIDAIAYSASWCASPLDLGGGQADEGGTACMHPKEHGTEGLGVLGRVHGRRHVLCTLISPVVRQCACLNMITKEDIVLLLAILTCVAYPQHISCQQ